MAFWTVERDAVTAEHKGLPSASTEEARRHPFAGMTASVAVSFATSVPSANTSDSTTERVRPGRRTFATDRSSLPRAGRTRSIEYSVVSTPGDSSAIVVTAPPAVWSPHGRGHAGMNEPVMLSVLAADGENGLAQARPDTDQRHSERRHVRSAREDLTDAGEGVRLVELALRHAAWPRVDR
jgi:hypothetical protein